MMKSADEEATDQDDTMFDLQIVDGLFLNPNCPTTSVASSHSESLRESSKEDPENPLEPGHPGPSSQDQNSQNPTAATVLPKKVIRNDLQILRALSIILVVLYHLNIFPFTGGFIGVDIFFVLSGYLVTGPQIQEILFKAAPKKDDKDPSQEPRLAPYSLVDFFARRVKRLFPASFLCLVMIWLATYFTPFPLPNIYESISAASMNLVNIFFVARSGDYGGSESNDNMVTHYWSLNLEWQWYFFSPIGFMLFRFVMLSTPRLARYFTIWTIRIFLGLVCIGSVAFCLLPIPSIAKFFLLPARVWEFILGGVIFIEERRFPHEKVPIPVLILPFAFLVFMSCWLDLHVWPNFWTLLVVITTCFIILCQKELPRTLEIASLLELIGNWSYSIYLYHWPIIKIHEGIALYFQIDIPLLILSASVLFLTLIFAVGSYYLIETGIPPHVLSYPTPRTWCIMFVIISMSLPLAVLGLQPGYPPDPALQTFPPEFANQTTPIVYPWKTDLGKLDTQHLVWNLMKMKSGTNVWEDKVGMRHAFAEYRKDFLMYTKRREDVCFLLIGDSHAQQWHYTFNSISGFYDASFYRATRSCPTAPRCPLVPLLDIIPRPDNLGHCRHVVSFVGTWWYEDKPHQDWYDGLNAVLKYYAQFGPTFLMEDSGWPHHFDSNQCIKESSKTHTIQKCRMNNQKMISRIPKYEQIANSLNHVNVTSLNFMQHVVQRDGNIYAYNGEIPVSYDDNHWSQMFIRDFTPTMFRVLLKTSLFKNFVQGISL